MKSSSLLMWRKKQNVPCGGEFFLFLNINDCWRKFSAHFAFSSSMRAKKLIWIKMSSAEITSPWEHSFFLSVRCQCFWCNFICLISVLSVWCVLSSFAQSRSLYANVCLWDMLARQLHRLTNSKFILHLTLYCLYYYCYCISTYVVTSTSLSFHLWFWQDDSGRLATAPATHVHTLCTDKKWNFFFMHTY